ncbi:Hypothetical predicted protein [Mytilus galloprovincialis]|uniref:Uncharacterized protein n=1 Tax=Mytilus galloprovincialis TaxID=29158 RepID=A0A8B6EUD0_MYTGA|nr:Hypothetical predicted protein [Mytilus galloprovincialis]
MIISLCSGMLVTSFVSSQYVNKQAWPRICERQYNDTTMDYRFTDDEREQIDIPKVKLTMSVQLYMYESVSQSQRCRIGIWIKKPTFSASDGEDGNEIDL